MDRTTAPEAVEKSANVDWFENAGDCVQAVEKKSLLFPLFYPLRRQTLRKRWVRQLVPALSNALSFSPKKALSRQLVPAPESPPAADRSFSRSGFDSSKIYPFMVDLSCTCNDVVFLLVMGDESEKTREEGG